MTHFLEVSALREGLQEIQENAEWLRRLLAMTHDQRTALEQNRIQQGDMTTHADDVRGALFTVLQRTEELVSLLDQFESAPIVYTGEGNTAEVLVMLERLMAQAKASEER